MTPKELKDNIINLLQEKKADDLVIIDVAKQTSVADYFIIASGKSSTQVRAFADFILEKLEQNGIFASRKEGEREARWIVLDYGCLIVHIFNDEMRDIYNLEKLWGNASNITRVNQ